MNERIKELWENCDEIHTRYPKKGSPIYASPELLEKFAELIVQECLEICRSEDWEDQQGWGKLYAHKIKKHFEIK